LGYIRCEKVFYDYDGSGLRFLSTDTKPYRITQYPQLILYLIPTENLIPINTFLITDTNRFLKMSAVEKRAILRASGVTSLPRPREGLASLDRALVEQMDEAVKGEFLRLLSNDTSGYIESPRQGKNGVR
jgi:hypothetical protein